MKSLAGNGSNMIFSIVFRREKETPSAILLLYDERSEEQRATVNCSGSRCLCLGGILFGGSGINIKAGGWFCVGGGGGG